MNRQAVIATIIVVLAYFPVHAGDIKPDRTGYGKGPTIENRQPIPFPVSGPKNTSEGVRGAIPPDSDMLYWKHDGKRHLLNKDELNLFKEALTEAMWGNRGNALKMFERFSLAYPESPLHIDAKKAIEKLKAAGKQ